jgi:phosphoribosylformylglycinamidine synthase
MILAVGPENIDRLTDIFEKENVDITVIGRFTGTKRLCLFYAGTPVCDLDMDFLHGGLPPIVRKAVWKAPRFPEPRKKAGKDLTGELLGLLSSLNIASKEWIIRQYDHEVQGGSVIKPLQGAANDGPGDACVTRPLLNSKKGVVVGCGINADYGRIDPYWMAASAIDEALRQIVAVGADITRCAILDNFCWGNTDKEDRLGGLVRAARACYDIARAYGVPFISGKDSLNNEYFDGKKSIPIPPTLLISAIAVMDDISRAITMDFKKPGNAVYLIGLTHDELGGSQYYKNTGFIGNGVPKVSARYGRRLMSTLAAAIRKGLIRSCHDCSDGGLAVAVAESAFAGGHGAEIRFSAFKPPRGQKRLPDDVILFSESNTRFLVEVRDEKRFAAAMKGMPIWKLGLVTEEKALRIYGSADKPVISAGIDDLKKAWQRPFKDL